MYRDCTFIKTFAFKHDADIVNVFGVPRILPRLEPSLSPCYYVIVVAVEWESIGRPEALCCQPLINQAGQNLFLFSLSFYLCYSASAGKYTYGCAVPFKTVTLHCREQENKSSQYIFSLLKGGIRCSS